jgi:hypothetical protein
MIFEGGPTDVQRQGLFLVERGGFLSLGFFFSERLALEKAEKR